ncbi:MAG: 1,2-phenylacetyl-CoA epoxidase subunit PaaD [Halioglobus sp.]
MNATTHIPLLPIEQRERQLRRRESATPELWDILDSVMDPEIPVISIWELGVLQDLHVDDGCVVVTITPTYSGCPAMTVMAEDIEIALKEAGYQDVNVRTRLSPAWTTDWMSSTAKDNLRNYGIAPPSHTDELSCPRCESTSVKRISEFGSTACKSLYKCGDCAELFDHFKNF